jgi:hypothetical protein
MQDIKRNFPKNSEEEITISEIIHLEFYCIKKLMREAEIAKRKKAA